MLPVTIALIDNKVQRFEMIIIIYNDSSSSSSSSSGGDWSGSGLGLVMVVVIAVVVVVVLAEVGGIVPLRVHVNSNAIHECMRRLMSIGSSTSGTRVWYCYFATSCGWGCWGMELLDMMMFWLR